MSVCVICWSLFDRNCLKTGSRSNPGNPLRLRRSSSRNRPASRFDSPSRIRSLVVTLRVPKVGAAWPPTLIEPLTVLFSTTSSRMISPS